MTVKVVGAGFGRTGTMSLKSALEQLGFMKCYHMFEVSLNEGHVELWRTLGRGEKVDLEALFEGYQASVDWPSCNYWREQLEVFPDARVILSRRDPERWYESVMNTIYPSTLAGLKAEDPVIKARVQMAFEVIWDAVFDGRMQDKDHVISVFEAHNQDVIDSVPAEKLLVFEAREGWAPLCEFLEVPVPDMPYPKTNTTEDFLAMVKARAQS